MRRVSTSKGVHEVIKSASKDLLNESFKDPMEKFTYCRGRGGVV
jgi:hypothetical protein